MSDSVRNSAGSIGTVSNLTPHRGEIERLLSGWPAPPIGPNDIEDPSSFAMEQHLEEFLVKNWPGTELGKDYDIYEEEGEKAQQYQTDTGPLDILASSKDKECLLAVEQKKGRAGGAVVGQILRCMCYVNEVLAEPGQEVKGAIIAYEDDKRIRRAQGRTPIFIFYRYQISF